MKAERNAIALGFPWWAREGLSPPLWVRLTRVSPGSRPMDDDGVVGAMKAVRDQVALELGVDDGQRHLVRFSYAQERGPWGVIVEIKQVARRSNAPLRGGRMS